MKLVEDSIVEQKALTLEGRFGPAINGLSFQESALTTVNGWQYVAYYDGDRHVCIGRRDLASADAHPWQIIRFQDYRFQSDDAHNVVSMGICNADGTIHLAFDHHVSALHYRVSQPGVALHPKETTWDAGIFGPVTDTLDRKLDHLTYPRFVSTPTGGLQLFYRFGGSGAGDRWMIDYDAPSHAWTNRRQIDSGKGAYQDTLGRSTSRNGYENGYSYGSDGKLYSTWCWRESANHDICYAWSDDKGVTWKNNAGVKISSGDGASLISIASPGITVVTLDRTLSLMNSQAQAVDSKGRMHCVMWHRKDDVAYGDKPWNPTASAYFHYWRDDDGKWQRSVIPSDVGNRPKMAFDANDNLYAVFMVNRDPAALQADLYFPDGELRIARATAAAKWTDWTIIHKDPGHYLNEPLLDVSRFARDGILSIFAQDTPKTPRDSTPLHVLNFTIDDRH